MARHRSFETLGTLTPIMHVFWRQGFERTTLRDLERATGLNRVSLYNAFGDKRAIFLAALRH